MRAAVMLRGAEAILLGSLVLNFGYASALPLQLLPAIPGYVPVYIRTGDQPLEEINPVLAEAFHEKRAIAKIAIENDPIDGRVGPDTGLLHSLAGYEENLNDQESSEESRKEEKAALMSAERATETSSDEESGENLTEGDHTEKTEERKVVDLEAVAIPRHTAEGDTIPKLVTAQELQNQKAAKPQQSDSFGETQWDKSQKLLKRKPISVSKEAVIEVSSVLAQEKDDLEKLAAEVEKEESRTNEVADPNPNYPELPSEVPQNHNSQDFGLAADIHQESNEKVTGSRELPVGYETSNPPAKLLEANDDAEIGKSKDDHIDQSVNSQEAVVESRESDYRKEQTNVEGGESAATY